MWFVHRDVKRPRESFASHPSMFLLRFTEFQEKVTTVTICQKEEDFSTTFQVLHAHKKEFQNLRGMQITSTCRDRRGWEWWWWRRPQMLPPPRQAPKKMLKISFEIQAFHRSHLPVKLTLRSIIVAGASANPGTVFNRAGSCKEGLDLYIMLS